MTTPTQPKQDHRALGLALILAAVLALLILAAKSIEPVTAPTTSTTSSTQAPAGVTPQRDYAGLGQVQRSTPYIAGGCVWYSYHYGARVGDTSRAYKVNTFYHEARGQFANPTDYNDWYQGWKESNSTGPTMSAEQLRVKYNECLSLLPYNIQ